MKKFTLSAVFILLVLTAFCQPKNHPCPKFKRNNGQGTCGGDAQIRVYWADCSDEAPVLTAIYYEGKKLEGNTYGAPDQKECAKKGYTSYCVYGKNIPPAKKLTLHFSYSDGTKKICEDVPEGPPTNPPGGGQECTGNMLIDANGYYYGGFEAGLHMNNFSSTTGQTDLDWGSHHGAYQIVDDGDKAADIKGGGYTILEAHSGENFMLIHTDDSRLWYTNVSVTPGATYSFCGYIGSAKNDPTSGFLVQLKVKAGSTTTVIGSATAKPGVWSQICGTYTVPAGVTSIQLQVIDPFPNGISNFLALDDLCFSNKSGLINPDINVTYVNVPVPGNVSTNDKVPAGSTYGTPVLNSKPAGSTATINMNSNGTYTFVANTVGVYTYRVPVCSPGQTTNCPTSLLTITVLDKNVTNNPPVANTDIAVTKQNTPVTINSLANDRPGNPGGTLNTAITITSQPKHGTVTVNSTTGATTYTPAAGYVGMDTLTYRVCETPSGQCATALQIIRVQGSNAANTTSAADDYATTPLNTAVTGNVKTNDTDAEGNTQTVVAQSSTTVSGKGTLVLNSNGTYTFTPVAGFTGPVSFAYTTCDNGTPQACASATLYILVTPAAPTPNLTPIIEYLPSITHGTQRISIVTTVAETKGFATNGVITVYVARDPKYTIIWDQTATTAGGKAINNSVWTLDNSNPGFYIFRTNSVIAGNAFSRFGFDVIFNPNNSNGQTTITASILQNSGGESTADAVDNTDSDVLIYFLQ